MMTWHVGVSTGTKWVEFYTCSSTLHFMTMYNPILMFFDIIPAGVYDDLYQKIAFSMHTRSGMTVV